MSGYLKKKELLEAMLLHMSAIKDPYELKLLYDRICDNEFDAEPATPKDQCLCGLCGKRGISPCPLWSDGTPCVQQSAKNETQKMCAACNGTGVTPGVMSPITVCPICHGFKKPKGGA